MNRGRAAIELALRALGLNGADEVVLPSYVCRSVLDAVIAAGACPVFADVGPDLHLTESTVAAALTPSTRCVIVPHLFGRAAPVGQIEALLRPRNIALIDDAAQSLGAREGGRLVGTFGRCGIVSCGPGKSLAGSAGGALVTNDFKLYERAAALARDLEHEQNRVVARRVLGFWVWRRLRRWTLPLTLVGGWADWEPSESDARPALLSNLEAGVARLQLEALDEHAGARRRHAEALLVALGPLAAASILDRTPDGCAVKLVLLLDPKEPGVADLIDRLAIAGVECQGGYAPLHAQYAPWHRSLAVTESCSERVLCIPLETPIRRAGLLARLVSERRPPRSQASISAQEAR